MFGTTSPRGPATAMPRWTYRFVTTSPDASSHDEFREGWSCSASTTARATTASGVTWSPSKRRLCRSRSTSSTVGVASTVRKTQACGAVATLRTMASAMCFWTPRTGVLVSRWLCVVRRRPGEVRGQVLARDDPAGAVAAHVRQVDAVLAGHEAHGWRGERAVRAGVGGVGGVSTGTRSRCPLPLRRRRLGGASDGP